MTKYSWASGFPAPKGVTAEALGKAIKTLLEPTPEALLQASKAPKHILHAHLWADDDKIWANRARLEECRHLLAAIKQTFVIGGGEIEVRAVEFLREDGDGKWHRIEAILRDPKLHHAYMAEIKHLQQQALDKLDRFMVLLQSMKN